MHRTSMYNIVIDFKTSQGSFLHDKNTKEEWLDFFGMYSSLPLGYNHPVFESSGFLEEIENVCRVKIPNCEIITEEGEAFLKEFKSMPSLKNFSHFHFCSTGALAVEAAVKTACDHRGICGLPMSIGGAFHGIYGVSSSLTDRTGSSKGRLEGMPRYLSSERNSILVEPILCTSGDIEMSKAGLMEFRRHCSTYNIPLIYDEIQTGFGSTGKMWAFEHSGIEPDILIFGKKAQVSGVAVKEKFAKIFQTPSRLECTWDGDLMDMIRSKYILQEYKRSNLLQNATDRGQQLLDGLKRIPFVMNPRGKGLIVAFDLETKDKKIELLYGLRNARVLVNPYPENTVRLRPHMAVTKEEIDLFLTILESMKI